MVSFTYIALIHFTLNDFLPIVVEHYLTISGSRGPNIGEFGARSFRGTIYIKFILFLL